MLDSKYTAKIADFDVAKRKSDEQRTQSVGTSYYVAPEVVLGKSYNEKCDVYVLLALKCIGFHIP